MVVETTDHEYNKLPKGLLKKGKLGLGSTFSKVVTMSRFSCNSPPPAATIQCVTGNKVISLRPAPGPGLSPSPSQPMQKLPTASPYLGGTNSGFFDCRGGDANVDDKASDYILYVRERFKQERSADFSTV